MARAKTRLNVRVDVDIYEYLESEVSEIRKKLGRNVYLSTFMNEFLKAVIREDRVDKRFTEHAKERLLGR